MPLWKCGKCHHEWESIEELKCNWCGYATPVTLQEITPFEKFIKKLLEHPEKFLSKK